MLAAPKWIPGEVVMSRTHLSIITPSFNQGCYIERTIRSVLDQKGEFDLQYIVVDGGSTDGTLDILRRHEGRLVWVSEKDKGQVDAINKGLRQVTGDIVAWINSDDIYCPGAFQRVVHALEECPDAKWLHSRSEMVDENDHPIRRWISAYKHRRCLRHSFEGLLTENYIHQPSVFWRRRAMEDIGLLDPASELAFDYDWFLRLAQAGCPIYIGENLACLRWYPGSKSGAQYARQLREAYAIARKHDPGGVWREWERRFRLGRILQIGRAHV
jgi:glycosyltransferase involved in cell wall biosynthesis